MSDFLRMWLSFCGRWLWREVDSCSTSPYCLLVSLLQVHSFRFVLGIRPLVSSTRNGQVSHPQVSTGQTAAWKTLISVWRPISLRTHSSCRSRALSTPVVTPSFACPLVAESIAGVWMMTHSRFACRWWEFVNYLRLGRSERLLFSSCWFQDRLSLDWKWIGRVSPSCQSGNRQAQLRRPKTPDLWYKLMC